MRILAVFYLEIVFFNFLSFGAKLESQDPVLINFRRENATGKLNSGVYLPPEAIEPLIIDNRARDGAGEKSLPSSVVIDSITKIDLSEDWVTPSADFRGPSQGDERDGRQYPFSNLARLGQRSNTRNNMKLGSGGRKNSDYVRVNEMSCHYSGEDLYFRASLGTLKRTDHPLVDNVSNELCKIVKIKSEYRLKFEKDNFWNCGVTDCSTELGTFFCLTVRFPTISGLRLKDDTTITLQCKTQDKTASHTTQINVKSLNTAGRMAPRVAAGGLKNAFQSDVGIFRKSYNSENLFDVKISPGGTVVLGEEILLRALVRDGDGWKYSRIGEVSVQYIETRQQQRVMNSLWILDAEGCRNPEISEICPNDQYRVAPLESYLVFEAFMFENMKETDEMVISVKVTGCLEPEDCSLKCTKDRRARKTRSLIGFGHESKANVTDWQSDIAFKVVRGTDKNLSRNYSLDDPRLLVPYVLTAFFLAISVGLLCLVKSLLKQRSSPKK